jgi:DNA-directed RNA polymerase specialized sigma24 family protein
VITYGGSVEQVWPEVSARLTAYLRSRGTSAHDCEDLVQECAARLLHHQVAFSDASDLLRWCVTVARNGNVDLHRRRPNAGLELVRDLATDTDVHREVTARLELQAVTTAWKRLSPADQRVLADAVEQAPAPPRRTDAVREYVRRNRARRRLEGLLAALLGVLVGLGRSARRALPALGTTTAAAVVTGLALSPWSATTSSGDALGTFQPGVTRPQVQQVHADPASSRRLAVPVAGRPAATRPSTAAAPPTASLQGPGGTGATVAGQERPAGRAVLVCAEDLGVVPDTCVPDPTD